MRRFVEFTIRLSALVIVGMGLLAPTASAAERSSGASFRLDPAPGSPYSVQGAAGGVAVADFTGDGAPGFAVASRNVFPCCGAGLATVFLSVPGGAFGGGSAMVLGGGPVSLSTGDLNGDGKADLIAATDDASGQQGIVSLLLSNGDGTFTSAPNSPIMLGHQPERVVAAALAGSGPLDIITLNFDHSISVLLGHGDGSFSSAPGSPIAVGGSPTGLLVADFNADGKPDLAITDPTSGSVSVLLGNGDGTFSPAPGAPTMLGPTMLGSAAIGDFNGDGKPDLAIGSQTGTLSVLLGTGSGTFTPAPGTPISISSGAFVDGVVAGNYDANATEDLAVSYGSQSTDGLTLLLGNGNGSFEVASGSPFSVGPDPTLLAGATFGGHPALLVNTVQCCPANLGQVSIWLPTEIAPPPPPPTPIATRIRAMLRALLARAKTRLSTRSVLRHGGQVYRFSAPVDGRLTISWTTTARQARRARLHTRTIATRTVMIHRSGSGTVKARLTRTGRRFLHRVSRLRVTMTASFKGPAVHAVTLRRSILLVR